MEITKDKITEIFCIIDDFCHINLQLQHAQYENIITAYLTNIQLIV